MPLATSTSAKALQRASADKCVYLYDGSLLVAYWSGTAGQVAQVTSPLTSPSVTNLITTAEDGVSLWADNSSGTSSYIWVVSSDDDASGSGPALHVRSGTYTSGGGFSWNTATSVPGTTTSATIQCSVTWNGTYLMVFLWDGSSGTDRLGYAYTADKTGQSGWTSERTLNGGTWSTITQVAARHSAKLGATVIAYGGNSRLFYGALPDGTLGQATGATASETGAWSGTATTAVAAGIIAAVKPSGASPVLSCGDPKQVRATAGSVTAAWGNGQQRTAGNLLVAVVSATGTTSAATVSTPSGWSQAFTAGGGTAATCAVYTKTADGADAAPAFTSTISGTATMTAQLLELVNAATSSIFDTSGTNTGSGTVASLALTTSGNVTSAGDYLLSVLVRERAAGTTTYTPGSGWWNVVSDGSTSSTGHCSLDVKGAGPELNNWAGNGATGFYSFTDNYTNFGGPQLVIDEASGDIHCVRAMTTGGGPTNSGICYWHGTYSAGTVSWSSVLVVDADGAAATPADIGAAVDGSSALYVTYTDAATAGNLKYAKLVSPFTSIAAGPTVIVAGSGSHSNRWPHSPPVSAAMGGLGTALPVLYTDTFSSPFPVLLDTSVTLPGGTVSGSAALTGSGSLTAPGQFAGSAALTGTGSLTATGQLAAATALSGTGSLNAAITIRTSAALSGAGTLSASPASAGSASLTGSGALAAAPAFAPAAALSGAGSLAAAGRLSGSAVLAGAGTLSASPQFAPGASLSGTGSLELAVGLAMALTGTGALSAGGALTGVAGLAGAGTLSAGSQLIAAAALTGSGALTAAGTLAASASLAGSGSLTATGQLAGSAPFTGSGTLAAAGQFAGSAALAGSGSLTAVGSLSADAVLAGLGTLSGAGQPASAAALSGAGSLRLGIGVGAGLAGSGTLSASSLLAGSAALSGTGALAAAGQFASAVALTGSGSLTPASAFAADSVLTGAGTLSAAGQLPGGASLTGTGSLALRVGLAAALSGSGSLTASYGGLIGASGMSGSGSLIASPVLPGAATLSGTGTLAAGPQLSAGAAMSGTGSLTAAGQAGSAAALTGRGTLAVAGQFGIALSGTGTLSAVPQLPAALAMSGSGSLTVSGSSGSAAALSGSGTLAAVGRQPSGAALVGAGSLAAQGMLSAAVVLVGAGALSVSPARPGGAALSGTGSLAAQWAVAGAAAAALTGSGSLSAAYVRAYAAAVALSGSGVLLAQGASLTGVLGTCLAVNRLAYSLAAADWPAYSAGADSRLAYSARAADRRPAAVGAADKIAYSAGADD
jgi:hypothetical protein